MPQFIDVHTSNNLTGVIRWIDIFAASTTKSYVNHKHKVII